jgi:hypothetical protein
MQTSNKHIQNGLKTAKQEPSFVLALTTENSLNTLNITQFRLGGE